MSCCFLAERPPGLLGVCCAPCPRDSPLPPELTSPSIIAIIFAFICVLLLATFPVWHEETDSEGSQREIKPFPSRPVSQVALAIIFIAAIFVLVSVLWQHTASVAASVIAEDMANGSVRSGVGTSAMVMGWFGFTLLIITTIGLLVMILSISVLSQMAGGSHSHD